MVCLYPARYCFGFPDAFCSNLASRGANLHSVGFARCLFRFVKHVLLQTRFTRCVSGVFGFARWLFRCFKHVLHQICFARRLFGVLVSCAILFWVFRRVLFRVCFARCQICVFRIASASRGACLGLSSTYCFEFVSRGICLVFLYRVCSSQGLFVPQACINHRKSTRTNLDGLKSDQNGNT